MENIQQLFGLVAASFVAAGISFTVTISGMFEPMRNWIYDRSKFFGKLFTCPWCFGHYVVFIMLGSTNLPLLGVSEYGWINFLFTSFFLISLMGIWHKTLLIAYDPVAKIKAQRDINKLRDLKTKSLETNK